jgi:hypothetical protein
MTTALALLALVISTTKAIATASDSDAAVTAKMRAIAGDLRKSLGVDLNKDQVEKIMVSRSSHSRSQH